MTTAASSSPLSTRVLVRSVAASQRARWICVAVLHVEEQKAVSVCKADTPSCAVADLAGTVHMVHCYWLTNLVIMESVV